ncbi:hypothetical protein NEF87_000142 [Candidatus Lokiarchaeum ossiferum]|uniref:Uncharacterized protein n=1 Tax=Candidatus Lokiarchaeum ossiferum TaxID=2951803 RepID=A0ABY6HLT7_9ARCH|nr:hypothetical protein NEF87_000142 [Candidatus Lokiarchaeum sp. B-35]
MTENPYNQKTQKEIDQDQNEKEKALKLKKRVKIEKEVLRILRTGKVVTKLNLTRLLVLRGLEYKFRINLISNAINPEIPELGGVLKQLRWKKKIKFSIENGSHVFYINKTKPIKVKSKKLEFKWKSYKIPQGKNEVYMLFKLPTAHGASHFFSSCNPIATFKGFKIAIPKKAKEEHKFDIFKDKLDGYIENNILILRCFTTEEKIDKTAYTLIQIGRKIIKEMLQMSRNYSKVPVINEDEMYIPTVPIFRAKEKQAFYTTKFNNVFKYFYDFPQLFEGKHVFGNSCILTKEIHDEQFDLASFFPKCEEYFANRSKSFINTAMSQDWIINPQKVLNFGENAELDVLIDQYLEEINTNKIIDEKIDENIEKGEFIKETISNILLTLLGLSFLAEETWLKGLLVGTFVIVNSIAFLIRRKKLKERKI